MSVDRRRPRIAVVTTPTAPWLVDAVEAGGAGVVTASDATAAVFGAADDPEGLADLLAENPDLDWVQLPWAGVEPYRDVIDHGRRWTCGKGVYAVPVAEHALALGLAGLRGLVRYGQARSWDGEKVGTNLIGGRVTVVGGGGIADALLDLLAGFRAEATVVRRHPRPMPGAVRVVGVDALDEVLPGADLVVLALPAVPDTIGIIDGRRLALMAPHTWLVNVARGALVVTDDLVAALGGGVIGGAALDVTDPEPLPDGHPLWSEPNCLITPHAGNTPEMARPLLAARVTENVRRYAAGEELLGSVDPDLGY